MHAQLRHCRVAVRRERVRLDDDLVAAGARPVKTGHEQVQVDRQRVHGNDLGRFRAGQLGESLRCPSMEGNPRPVRVEVAVNGIVGPVVQFLADELCGEFRLQAQRVAAQIDRLVPVSLARKIELVTKACERVSLVEIEGEFASVFVIHRSSPANRASSPLADGYDHTD